MNSPGSCLAIHYGGQRLGPFEFCPSSGAPSELKGMEVTLHIAPYRYVCSPVIGEGRLHAYAK